MACLPLPNLGINHMSKNISMLVGLIAVTLLIGCATPTSESMANKWKGRKISEAMQVLGPPNSTMPLPNGIMIYTWEEQYGSSTAAVRGYCRTGLHVDTTGTIVDASQVSRSLLCK